MGGWGFPIQGGMSERVVSRISVRPGLIRLLVLVASVGGFFILASIFNPEQTRATVQGVKRELSRLAGSEPTIPPGAAKPPARDSYGRMLLGEMVGRDYRVWVYGRGAEVRYTVCTPEGVVVTSDMTADDVYRLYPDLNLRAMRLDTLPDSDTGAVMMVEPRD